jgi:hypothetical protein
MVSNRFAFAALGLACVAAAAGGSYLATRHNAADHMAPPLAAEAISPAGAPVVDAGSAPTPAAAVAERTDGGSRPAPRVAATPSRAPESSARVPARAANTAPSRSSSAPATRIDQATAADHAPGNSPAASPLAPAEPLAVARNEEHPVELPKVVEPPEPTFEELTVAPDSVVGLRTETTLSSERARVEDPVEARVVRDVRAGGRVAIPAGTRALGSVVLVERGGKMRDRARLGIRFHTLALADGTRLPITTETIYRYGDAPGNDSAKKIGGGAVAGAILGAIIGGGKGAAIGATTGAAGGSAAVMAGDRSEAVFPSGAEVTARFLSPVTVTVDR